MTKKKSKNLKTGEVCINHPDNYETKECERCHEFFCADCITEDWSTNFFQQFIGQKRDFIQKIYCHPCRTRVVRIRVLAYLMLLLLFAGPIVLWLISSIFLQS